MLSENIKNLKQWVVWKKDKKRGKIPFQVNGLPAAANDSDTWNTYDVCHTACMVSKRFSGIGIVLDCENPILTIIDLDNCFDETGNIKEYAQQIVNRFNSYTEISQSEKGLHIFIYATKKTKRCRVSTPFDIEIYDSSRFIAVTENMFLNVEIAERQEELDKLCNEIFPQESEEIYRPTVNIDISDDDLFEIMMKDKIFKELWQVPTKEHHSDLDQSLCNKLAFYCGRDPYKIDYFFRKSPLMRDKWEKRQDYRDRTINKAISGCSDVYTPAPKTDLSYIKDDISEIYDKLEDAQKDKLTELGEAFVSETVLLNDNFLSSVFSELNKENLIYSTKEMEWFSWTGIEWKQEPEIDILEKAKGVQEFLFNLCQKVENDKLKARLTKFITSAGNLTKIKSFVELSKTLLKYDGNFNSIKTKINCLNGIIDLKKCVLLPHDKNEYWNKTCPVEFNRDYGRAEAPYFFNFLDQIVAATDNPIVWIKWLQHVAGYCLTGETREQQGFFLYGSSGTGKSTFVNLLVVIMGPFAGILPNDFFMIKNSKSDFDTESLKEKRLVLSSESTDSKYFDEERFKTFLGETDVYCNRKFKTPIIFTPQCKFVFTLNELPQYNISKAMTRRINLGLIDNTNIIPDKFLREKLMSELPGIFAWAVKGAFGYYMEGIPTPEGQEEILKDYIKNNNHFARFINENYDVFISQYGEVDDTKFVICNDLYRHYVRWCDEQGENPRSQAKTIRQIKEITGLAKVQKCKKYLNNKATNVVYGLQMKEKIFMDVE